MGTETPPPKKILFKDGRVQQIRKIFYGNGTPAWFEKIILGTKDPTEPVNVLALLRTRLLVALSLAIGILGVGLMLWSFQVDYKRNDEISERERQQLIEACEGRNTQSANSKKILTDLADDELDENEEAEKLVRNLAASTQSVELKRVLIKLAELEQNRDKRVSDLFRSLANNVRTQDCKAQTKNQ